ncbi:MAG: acyloxyacyl hydrolase [Tannerellaceae bacterium]|jgi:hypothetical protein|nr:acyloxyacyl hydrolase [Tannerellaceae bacterium]
MAQRRYLLPLTALLFAAALSANDIAGKDSTGIKKKAPRFMAINTMGGVVIPTNEYIKSGKAFPAYSSFSVKAGVRSTGNRWEDHAYGMPYYGIGLYAARFYNKKALGNPITVFAFQGGNIKTFSRQLSLEYELNLGMSFNWKPYDVFDNPDNIALGSSVNAHVGANVYIRKRLSDRWDLHAGMGLTHFSNGAQRLPNKGINLFAPFVELAYNIDPMPLPSATNRSLSPPPLDKRIDYDIMFTSSTRQVRVDTAGTQLPSRHIDRNFKVFGLSYATLFVNSYKYRWGPSLELVYDESSGVRAWRERHPVDGQYYDRVKLGSVYRRFSAGLSIKGELTFQRVSFFANLGYNLLHGNTYDYRLYQIIGARVYLKDRIFATFGIRASHFSKAQYLYWSVGYTIKGQSATKKSSYINRILP